MNCIATGVALGWEEQRVSITSQLFSSVSKHRALLCSSCRPSSGAGTALLSKGDSAQPHGQEGKSPLQSCHMA